ncbi:MAG: hypothetical protein VCA57_11905 [Pseudomonas sp.]|uniref:hypothetical protein n=1 Tax=Pseudomonas sp. TaxID=306 RepID=UPI00398265A8
MTSIRSLALLLALLSVAACEQSANPPEQAKQPAVQEHSTKAAPAEKPLASKPSASKPDPAAAAVRPLKQQSNTASKSSTAPAKPKAPALVSAPVFKAPLDLSLPAEALQSLPPQEPFNDQTSSLLPPLFAEKPAAESSFQLNGKLITNERGDEYWQSVEGAELQFEFKQ